MNNNLSLTAVKGITKDLKDVTKDLLKNKYIIGSCALVGVGKGVMYIKNINVSDKFFAPITTTISNIKLMGIPIGSGLGKLLAISTTCIIASEIIKTAFEIKQTPDKMWSILFREGFSICLLIFGMYVVTNLGFSLLKCL